MVEKPTSRVHFTMRNGTQRRAHGLAEDRIEKLRPFIAMPDGQHCAARYSFDARRLPWTYLPRQSSLVPSPARRPAPMRALIAALIVLTAVLPRDAAAQQSASAGIIGQGARSTHAGVPGARAQATHIDTGD